MSFVNGEIQVTESFKKRAFTVFLVCCILLVVVSLGMNMKSSSDSTQILKESTSSQLMAICAAALEGLDVDEFIRFSVEQDMEDPVYQVVLANLRALAERVDATYIYALAIMPGEETPRFIIDTDTETTTCFDPYEDWADVHRQAFAGEQVAGIMNVVDEFGSFSTGAVPILKDGEVMGILCADIDDELLDRSIWTAQRNAVLLTVSLVIMLAIMCIAMFVLLSRVKVMQEKLSRMANYDKLTGLPNRQFLLQHLTELTRRGRTDPFALFFIDLDNFKKVNDSAGHDAGDALLLSIGEYLSKAQGNSTVYRPGAGALTITARIGGDEFVMLGHGIKTAEEASAFARELLQGFHSEEINKYIDKYNVGLSIGVALYPEHSDNMHVLIKYADIAMYHAKEGGKNAFMLYRDELKHKPEK